ncbi:hypothetical protein [Candidatus Vesicomyidisocius sp. SY067_SCS001]|uniref:hypothetical protein n=1 Tax=Candidatus Vesicomyidisocius sp. SY067_SCS001 TaxID=2732590 RepID=UPI00168833AB|nr:hypothetical protein [Candidatus Vesicomyosocius sp. SY067_SCS001]
MIRVPIIKRERVPANNVEVVEGLNVAMEKSDSSKNLYAAKVLGPYRSSEGIILYFILKMYNYLVNYFSLLDILFVLFVYDSNVCEFELTLDDMLLLIIDIEGIT